MKLDDTHKVKDFFEASLSKVEITDDRKALLHTIAYKTHEILQHTNATVYLNFICTHNSRRSQLAQVWASFAANYFKLPTIKAYSGGTAVTAFHRNTVKTLQKSGFIFRVSEFNHQNPKYIIGFNTTNELLLGFSKSYNDKCNSKPFIAITTCSSADENCPFIPSAIWRFHLPYNDPKEFDNTEIEEKAYLIANNQIAAEIFMLFSEVKKLQKIS